jgi:hypothetical protein
MQPFLAMITPLGGSGGGPVDPGFGVPGWPAHPIAPGGSPGHPAHPWVPPWGGDPGFGVPGWPAHPIAPGGRPPGIWGGPGSLPPWVMPPIAPGGMPPTWGGRPPPGYITGGPGWLPQQPPGIWGGVPPNYIDIGLPGQPPAGSPPGIWGPPGPWVTPPIYIPLPPDEKPPEPGNGLTPSNPIYIPGESGPGGVKQLVYVYVVGVGGVWFLVDVPTTGGAHPSHPIVEPPPSGGPKPA